MDIFPIQDAFAYFFQTVKTSFSTELVGGQTFPPFRGFWGFFLNYISATCKRLHDIATVIENKNLPHIRGNVNMPLVLYGRHIGTRAGKKRKNATHIEVTSCQSFESKDIK